MPHSAASFEFVPAGSPAALASVARLENLGRYSWSTSPVGAAELHAWLAFREPASLSGEL